VDGLTAGGFVGTPYFASPEQLEQRDEDVRSDIYSLGVTLWYMLTGKPTFSGSLASVIAQHLDKSPPFEMLASLPSQVVSLLHGMLEKDVSRRIQSPAELRVVLKRCIDGLRGTASSAAESWLGSQEPLSIDRRSQPFRARSGVSRRG
jgi:serine/threonine protein kinase